MDLQSSQPLQDGPDSEPFPMCSSVANMSVDVMVSRSTNPITIVICMLLATMSPLNRFANNLCFLLKVDNCVRLWDYVLLTGLLGFGEWFTFSPVN